ncbi:CDP-alcohol phosphatidyltransferase family protein [Glutamicibacter sp. MNS18]|uniref:CDP-alcohol phosphatidyltransferase family protein n=1 Tax=Glutamicibacter sp. MNS18 TaxID=2989817 RepID=UPI002235DB74|nr:CDP-alcohol phosphatidyltransferase family protein [Glutamicibacter sp. MNS18]MCW4466204.1 CDP-alcohol phosphatidyltransferase family protein [Glutamicibacter sp. MNS18]
MSVDRPKNPTLDQLREICQPPEVRARRNAEHWTAELYLRHISIYLTSILVRTRISANGVTGLMILSGWLMSLALLIPGIWGPLLAVFFSQLQLYFDCSDGEVARWRGTQSPKGIFIDMVGHHTTEALIPIALGYRVFMELSGDASTESQAWPTLFMAACLSVLLVLNRSQSLMVHAARGMAGLGKLPDTAAARSVPTTSLVGRLRSLARFLPFHKLLHAVELGLVILACAVVSAILGTPGIAEKWMIWILLPATVLVNIGHFLSSMASSRLK